MTDLFSNPVFWIVVTAASEIIGMTPKLKSNSVLQLVVSGILSFKPKGK